MTLKLSLVLLALTPLCGCTFAALYPTLTASADGLQSHKKFETIVVTDRLRIALRLEGYDNEGVGFIGPVIPVFPIVVRGSEGARMRMSLELFPKADDVWFTPGSARIIVNNKVHHVTRVINTSCRNDTRVDMNLGTPVHLDGYKCLILLFETVPLLHEPFVLTATEVPEIRYEVRVGADAFLVRQ